MQHTRKLMMMVNFFYYIRARPIGYMSLINNYPIGDGEGVILEDDSEDEEGYMFAGMGILIMFHDVACISCAYFLYSY